MKHFHLGVGFGFGPINTSEDYDAFVRCVRIFWHQQAKDFLEMALWGLDCIQEYEKIDDVKGISDSKDYTQNMVRKALLIDHRILKKYEYDLLKDYLSDKPAKKKD